MSIKSASAAVITAGLVLGPVGPLAAAPGDYVGNAPAPVVVPAPVSDHVTTAPVVTPTLIPPAGSDYAGIGSGYAGLPPTYAGIGSDHVGTGTGTARAETGDEPTGRDPQRAAASRFPVTSGDLGGLALMALFALGIVASLRRRTS